MFVTSIISIILGIVFFYAGTNIADDIVRLVVQLIAAFLLLFGITFAPLLIKLLIFMTVLITVRPLLIVDTAIFRQVDHSD